MEILKKILIVLIGILYTVCVALCVYMILRLGGLKKEFSSLIKEDKQRISQIADYEIEIRHLKSEIENLKKELREIQSEDEQIKRVQEFVEDVVPGEIIPASAAISYESFFTINVIYADDEVYNRIAGKSYQENNNISLKDLRYLKLLHYNFQHEIQAGEMVVHEKVAEDVLNIFKELFLEQYEIQSVFLIDNYWTGDAASTDTASIDVNNTSCFNYREVTGGSSLSNHAYGCAIDINPQQNPYVWYGNDGGLHWTHENANPYIDRTTGLAHVITQGDICYSVFSKYGFSWGGLWSNPIDYQHFEKKLY